jgi:hypothetical protein
MVMLLRETNKAPVVEVSVDIACMRRFAWRGKRLLGAKQLKPRDDGLAARRATGGTGTMRSSHPSFTHQADCLSMTTTGGTPQVSHCRPRVNPSIRPIG